MNIILFTVIYIIIVLGELYLVHSFVKQNKKKGLTKDFKTQDRDDDIICEELKKRIKLLEEMNFKDWIDYNQNNINFKINDETSGVFAYELIDGTKDNFVIRINGDPDVLHLDQKVQINFVRQKTSFSNDFVAIDGNTDQYYGIEWDDGCAPFSYVYTNPKTGNAVIKKVMHKKFAKEENGHTIKGFMGAGYSLVELSEQTNYYFDIITNYFLVILFLFVYLIIVVTYYITDKNIYESLFLFIILNSYSIFSLFAKDVIDNSEYENKLTDQLNSSILGISFLVAANIFVIQSLKNEKIYKTLYNETAFLFCCSLISLMIAMFKITDFKNAKDIKTHRIQNQIFFNLSIILNIFLFLNYFMYISNEKIISVLPKSFSKIITSITKKF